MIRAASAPPRSSGIERKSVRELEIMRQAGRIVAVTLAELRAHARPGTTTRQLDTLAEKIIRQHKAQPAFKGYPGPYPFPASTCISVNEELVHGIPGKRVLKEGDLVSIDCGVRHQGYYGDSAVSFVIGRVSPEAENLLAATEGALYAAIDMLRPGKRTGDVAAAIQTHVERRGFNVVRQYTSHGIGREMHEAPFIHNYGKAGTGPSLRPGMTIALEPMTLAGKPETRVLADQWTVASKDGKLTAHFEHTVAVTEGEPEILTRL
ncbi:MAG TPA: type I methionyl aminopeptidase [Anaerolineales bacterium]|uniref:Methionine aminopeptidase n=1 Tax=uncultured Chloroflexi bacterium Rifle_16ft_4_minimus_6153 TaxID=1665079 RepID=A0A0H4TUK8_9CHLR|nr:map, methionine aminopeptidase, methionyl aminopeptidase [uncultured Chloroflexi bacterium Rifle_16ft_4_minimus_6153]HLE30594.1 type I methionyl aminopeptidase [Anaerolineales bacterium]